MLGLKQCPFCGSDATIETEYNAKLKNNVVFAECQKCGCRTKNVVEREDIETANYDTLATDYVIKLWNERIKNE